MIWRLLIGATFTCLELSAGSPGATPFYYGAATSAVQVEGCAERSCGGKGPSIWDEFTKVPGRISAEANASIADDSYHKWVHDLAMIEFMGLTAYRFSISWPRLFPAGRGHVNDAGVRYYDTLINALLQRGVEPFVTLYHWDMPQALEEEYRGWLNRTVVSDFANYADFCFKMFGDRVKKWITINEPYTFVTLGYESGIHAPGRCSDRSRCPHGNSSTEPYIAGHNVILGHAAAVDVYRARYQRSQGGTIGITLNQDWGEPFNLSSTRDFEAAERRNVFQKAWFADPIYFGAYPREMVDRVGDRLPVFSAADKKLVIGSTDFLGLNHYTAIYIKDCGDVSANCTMDQGTLSTPFNASGHLIGPQAASVWLHVAPWAFYKMLSWNSQRYSNPPIYITENGVDVPGEGNMTFEQAWNDTFRVNYYSAYLQQLSRASKDGMNVLGYFAWSLIDNFEWADGYSVRFGLCYINYSDPDRLQRYPKRSAAWYRDYIQKMNGLLASDTSLNQKLLDAKVPSDVRKYVSSWQYALEELAKEMWKPTLAGGL